MHGNDSFDLVYEQNISQESRLTYSHNTKGE